MKKKNRISFADDDRKVAIYARKSRITHKGDSIGVQFKQSADYAKLQLSLPDDYEFEHYEDKGLSGYYSDRPDFQRLLHDIENGKIKAVACYKLDRISRKTADLMRLIEYFERFDVTLLVCSNNINTQISTSKIIIQVLAIIAEFERDTITERIQDNLMELSKDGRWLGGRAPTGFTTKRVSVGSGKNKTAITYLVSLDDEKKLVQKIFKTFLQERSICKTATIIGEDHKTKQGAQFTELAVKDILRNPIYCTADERAYQYFLDQDANVYGESSDYDGHSGISVYNRTDQYKIEDDDSTFFNPKFSQGRRNRDVSEWIIAVGRHEGIISSKEWIQTQKLLAEIAKRYNRPHRRTNALLAGLIHCPYCGKRLNVTSESDRWTNGKPRFKYTCPGYRKKDCGFIAVDGVLTDEFVVKRLSEINDENSEYYYELIQERIDRLILSDENEREYRDTKKAVEKIKADIAAQIRNMRDADDDIKPFYQEDINSLKDELEKQQAVLSRIEALKSESRNIETELKQIRKVLLSFAEYAKEATPEVLTSLIRSVVERIYVTTENGERVCHIFIKGCSDEDYSELFEGTENADKTCASSLSAQMCDSDKDCKLHPYLCGDTAEKQMRRDHARAGL